MPVATQEAAGKSILICSIAPEEFKIKRSYNWNGLTIPGCNGEVYTSLLVEDHMDEEVHQVDYNWEHAIHKPVRIEAAVIVKDFFANEKLTEKGCFIPKGKEPTAEELANARATRRRYLERCVRDGDSEYSRTGRVDDIPGEFKRAVAELGVTREWAFLAPAPTMSCPACGETLKPGVAVCKTCGAILDREKAEKFGLVKSAETQQEQKKEVQTKK